MRRTPTPVHRERGVAVVVVLLVTLALSIMAHAALVLAGTEWVVTRAEVRRVRLGREAAAALADVEGGLDSLPGSGVVPTAWGSVETLRLSPEVALAVSRGGARGGGKGSARILWAPDPAQRLAARTAWLQVAGGVVSVLGAVLENPTMPLPCPPGVAPSPGLPVLASPGGRRPHPGLGPVSLTALLSRLPPTSAADMVMDSTVVLGAEGGISLAGDGVGVVAAGGTVVLEPGARLTGWVWVGGDLIVRGSAAFIGIADVGGILRLEEGALVSPDPCAALAGMARAPTIRRPWGVGPLSWPAF